MERGGCVYILTNYNNKVIYIGVTSELFFRIKEHREKFRQNSFASKTNCYKLVYYEQFSTVEEAIGEEKRLKNWYKQWKINLITSKNPDWEDLFYLLE